VEKVSVEELKRSEIRLLFDKLLGDKNVSLSPVLIEVLESKESDFTNIKFSFLESTPIKEEQVLLKDTEGKGFVDCLFRSLQNHYVEKYPSLKRIRLADLSVDSLIASTKSGTGSDAKTSVVFKLEVDEKGIVEFRDSSRSIMYSSFVSALKAFEFYINCEAAFLKLQEILQNGKQRNRQDIVEKCKFDLSKITRMNSYEKEKRKC